ncbi:MAG: RDD family protein [Rubrobacter sp.]|nr:RDD family protein [Rubrobacter sp.]
MAAESYVAPPVAGIQEDVHVTGRRVLAILVDGVVLGIPFWLISSLFGTTSATNGGTPSASMSGMATLLYVVIFLLYYILMEGYLGQTLGKMLLGIKVVREDNDGVPGLGAATIRTLMRIIDGLFAYLVGFIAVMTSAKRQRLGDRAAHTLVVRK